MILRSSIWIGWSTPKHKTGIIKNWKVAIVLKLQAPKLTRLVIICTVCKKNRMKRKTGDPPSLSDCRTRPCLWTEMTSGRSIRRSRQVMEPDDANLCHRSKKRELIPFRCERKPCTQSLRELNDQGIWKVSNSHIRKWKAHKTRNSEQILI